MKKLSLSIRAIAEQTNLSPSTIWRASCDPSSVKKSTWKIIEQYLSGDTPTQKIVEIVIVVPNISNPFFASVVQGVVNSCQKHSIKVTLYLSNESLEIERRLFHQIPNISSIAVIWIPSMHLHKEFSFVESKNFLLAVIDRILKDVSVPITVAIDNEQLSYRATTLLIQGNCDNLIMLSGSSYVESYIAREKGFLRAIKEFGVTGQIVKVNNNTPKDAYDTVISLDFKNINGILSSTGYLATGILQGLSVKNIKLKKDVGFITFDSDSIMQTPLQISSIIQPTEEMGVKAVDLILDFNRSSKNSTLYNNNVLLNLNGTEKLEK